MGFLSGRVTALRFAVSGDAPAVFGDDHLEQLRNRACVPAKIATADGSVVGWAAGDSVLDLDFGLAKNVVNDALCFDLRVDTHKLPADLLKAYYGADLKALAKSNPSGTPSAKQKREAKESARQRLELEAKDGRFRKRKCVPVLWDRRSNEVLFGAASVAQVDRFASLFEQTFGVELVCQTAGERAASSGGPAEVPLGDAAPARFHADSPGDVAWIADEDSRDFLGNEFLLWLWWYTDAVSDTVKLADKSEVTVMLARQLYLDCPRGQTGRDGFASEIPVRLPEARRAAQAGKLPRRAGLTIVRHNEQYDLTLHAETLAVQSARLPPPDEDVTDPRAKLEARVDAVRGMLESLDALYAEFVRRRLSRQWASDLAGVQKWLRRDAA